MRNKLQVIQNKCVCFCLKFNLRQQIGAKEFAEINLLPTKVRAEERIAKNIFNYSKGTLPLYVDESFVQSRNTHYTRSHIALEIPSKIVT